MKTIYRMSSFTRKLLDRNEMFRIVKMTNGNIAIDVNYSLFGRGAYLEKDKNIILLAKKKKALSRALKCDVKDETYDELIKML